MNGTTHVDISLVAAKATDFYCEKVVAKAAKFPDSVRNIQVQGVGAHLWGHNFACLAHFCRPEVNIFKGYNWKHDSSLPSLDLPDRDVQPHPEEWPILPQKWRDKDPMWRLIKTLTDPDSKGSIAADEITYSTAASMAFWLTEAYAFAFKPKMHTEEAANVAGWILHFVQDCAVPHHAWGTLLNGHSEFESACADRWTWLRQTHAKCINDWVMEGAVATVERPRWICEGVAKESFEEGRVMWWKRQRKVDAALRRAVVHSVRCLRYLRDL